MTDIVERLRRDIGGSSRRHELMMAEAAAEIERLRVDNRRMAGDEVGRILRDADERDRLRAALQRIDGINDNPSIYNPDIEAVLRAALDEQVAK